MHWASWVAIALAAFIPVVAGARKRGDRPWKFQASLMTAAAVGFGAVAIAS